MIITQKWRRNEPSEVIGESITVTIIYHSFNKKEIDELEEQMPDGITVIDTEKSEEK